MKNNQFIKIWIIFFSILILIFIILNVRIKNVYIDGNEIYTDQKIEEIFFPNQLDRLSLFAFVKNSVFKNKKILYVEQYSIEFLSPISVHIQIYETPIVGCVEYVKHFLFFDKNGIIVESLEKNEKKIPQIEGLDIKSVVVGKQLGLENDEIMNTILSITQNIKKFDLDVSKVYYNSIDKLSIFIYNIEVFLGNNSNIEIKIQTLYDILPKIKDLSGYIDLSNAKENMINEKYVFKKNK
ncbi:MAG: cell division protein FtsQ/DivIB [Eubacteriales bacterium]|nr:cell division protein FtsQ/DivIB [Eubacteriales bacterium]